MRGRPILAVVTLALTAPSVAVAKPRASHHQHSARHALRCKRGYIKRSVRVAERRRGRIVRRDHRIVYVRVLRCERMKASHPAASVPVTPAPTSTPAPSTPAPSIRYLAQVDPSATQSPGDPLAVSYAYSADATSTVSGVTTDLASTASLPAGVLNFYSPTAPGQPAGLVCSMNVGGATTGGTCPITYARTGTYNVTTEYVPDGVSATTQTDTETISPYSTTTALPYTTAPASQGSSSEITTYTPEIIDQDGNAVTPYPRSVGFVIADVTAGWQLSPTLASEVGSFTVTGPPYTSDQICISSAGCIDISPSEASDSFTIQAIYAPDPSLGWSGSSSPAVPLHFSPRPS